MEKLFCFGKEVNTVGVNIAAGFDEQELVDAIKNEGVEGLFVEFNVWRLPKEGDTNKIPEKRVSLDFLERPEVKTSITKFALWVEPDTESDYEKIYSLQKLDQLYIANHKFKNLKLDVSKLPHLKDLVINGSIEVTGLDKIDLKELSINECKKIQVSAWGDSIEHLVIRHSKPFSIEDIIGLKNLRELILTQVPISSLQGIENFEELDTLELNYSPRLVDISQITKCKKLRKLEIEKCSRIQDFTCLGKIKTLQGLMLDVKEIPSLKFLDGIDDLKFFSFGSTSILDGDLTPCLRLKCVGGCNKRHHNLSYDDLPHDRAYNYDNL